MDAFLLFRAAYARLELDLRAARRIIPRSALVKNLKSAEKDSEHRNDGDQLQCFSAESTPKSGPAALGVTDLEPTQQFAQRPAPKSGGNAEIDKRPSHKHGGPQRYDEDAQSAGMLDDPRPGSVEYPGKRKETNTAINNQRQNP